MVKQTIQIFARVKPTKKTGTYEITEEDGSPQLHFSVPREISEGLVNNKKELYKFKFNRVFDRSTKQDEIFQYVAQPVINNVISGYNGTIFAYGQTGSGKTFTITGGAERYLDRGIIPRTLSYVYEHYEKNPEWEYTTHISYLEIYNENGYDLLDPKHESAKLEDLPKVYLMEDSEQNIHLKNLSTHQASNEEEALNLLFLGDTNRMIAETPMNQASTRSHCIFTIHISSRESGAATLRRSKLHLVDLAGSERVAKTGVAGLLLTEAKYINLSLHYLEQVIVSLSEKTRNHIPYRNSLMTSVLRDSLGGNCMTTMIATCSVEKKNIDESISTCRFAQRVAMIKNDAILNEELDPKLMIAKLKRDIQDLKEELAMATGVQRTDKLSEEDVEGCEEAVKRYLKATDPDVKVDVGADMRKIHRCFWIMKKQILEQRPVVPTSPESVVSTVSHEETLRGANELSPMAAQEVKKLKDILQQRDNEINILVNMLKKEKKRATDAIDQLGKASSDSALVQGSEPVRNEHSQYESQSQSSVCMVADLLVGDRKPGRSSSADNGYSGPKKKLPVSRENTEHFEEKTKQKILGNLSVGRQEAFELFRRDYAQNQMIDDNKIVLKQRYAEAKSLGEQVNQARVKINKLKGSIEQHRMSRVMQGLVDPNNPVPDEMEIDMKNKIEDEKNAYKHFFSRLRALKTEIEHLQHLLERSKVKLMKDFEIWWAEQGRVGQEQQVMPPESEVKLAWRTPPMSPNAQGHQQMYHDSPDAWSPPQSSPRSAEQPRAPIPGHIRQSLAHMNLTSREKSHTGHQSPITNQIIRFGGEGATEKIPLTGDAKADADIYAFLKARQSLLKHPQYKGNR